MNSIVKGPSPVLMRATEEDNVIDWTKFKQHQIEVEDKVLRRFEADDPNCLSRLLSDWVRPQEAI